MAFVPSLNPSRLVGREHLRQEEVSISGHERNHLFVSRAGEQFADISGVSGLDHVGDSRVFALLDYDRDGWQDVALINANAPLLQLFRNQIGASTIEGEPSRGVIALRFVGGNDAAVATERWSTRDGYGALATLDLGDLVTRREHRAGEGFAAQNSATMIVGVGTRHLIPSVGVRWPSGKVQETADVPAGVLLTIYENTAQSPTGEAFVIERYAVDP